jgi:processive 1,2-diacylglycerol beta-glucosyltransferase
MPPEILLRFKEKSNIDFKIGVVVTDFDVHYLWVHPEVDLYFVAGKLAKEKLIAYGINADKIKITGIPVMPQFLQNFDTPNLMTKWKFSSDKKRLLLMAGGAGVGNLEQTCKKILSKYDNIEVIALAGKNEKLLKNLTNLKNKYPNNFFPMGFTTEIHELMYLSDLIVTKPGGLSTSECLLMKKPMLLINPIPGQEEHNAEILTKLGVAVLAKNLLDDIDYMFKNLNQFEIALNNLPTLNSQLLFQEEIKKLLHSYI